MNGDHLMQLRPLYHGMYGFILGFVGGFRRILNGPLLHHLVLCTQ